MEIINSYGSSASAQIATYSAGMIYLQQGEYELAINYFSLATVDNGSCIEVVEGCLNDDAFNYNPDANTNNDSCCYIAWCTDVIALNYNYFACFNDDSCIDAILGCTNPSSFNYNPDANINYAMGVSGTNASNGNGLVSMQGVVPTTTVYSLAGYLTNSTNMDLSQVKAITAGDLA